MPVNSNDTAGADAALLDDHDNSRDQPQGTRATLPSGSSQAKLTEVEMTDALDAEEKGKTNPNTDEPEPEEEEKKEKPASGDAAAVAAAEPEPEPFRFWPLFWEVHHLTVGLNGYNVFFVKYLALQFVRLAAALSLPVLAFAFAERNEEVNSSDLSPGHYAAFAVIGVLNVVGRLVPPYTHLLVDDVKMQLQVEQSTAVVAKLFELEHNSMISTPTGQFAQLLAKVYTHMDKILPALYGVVFPVVAEVLIALVLISVIYGWVSLIQFGLFIAYTAVAYEAAKGSEERTKTMMKTMFSEWGKLLATANSYERAHFFDNVEHEVDKSRDTFGYMGEKILEVSRGQHVDDAKLTFVGLTVTIGFILLIPVATSGVTEFEVIALVFYVFTFMGSLDVYAQAVNELRRALVEYKGLWEFIETKSGVADEPDAIDLKRTKNPTIEFRDVSFSYGGRQILDHVSFKIKGGQTLGLVGASGCGKTTILRLLMRFYRQTTGTILVDGHDITKVTGRSLRRLFSVVTQDSQLFNGTIRDNIGYGKLGSNDDEILNAAKLAELELENNGDFNLDKECGEKGAKLSGGQQQRVALARAMLKNGSIYLLDEPTTGLDAIVARQLQETLNSLATHATSIIITHLLEDLRQADLILYLREGKIVERGTYESLLDSKGEFYQQVMARGQHKE